MHPVLSHFIRQYLGVVCATLIPVVLTTFLSIPLSLGRYPGEVNTAAAPLEWHMT